MTNSTRTVTLTLSSDLLTLGDDATVEDRDQYGDNLADLLEREFDVKVHQVVGSTSRTECDDAECRSRIRDIESGDEWTTLLDNTSNLNALRLARDEDLAEHPEDIGIQRTILTSADTIRQLRVAAGKCAIAYNLRQAVEAIDARL